MALHNTGYTTLAKLVINGISGLNVWKDMAWHMMQNVMSAMAALVGLVWQMLVVWHSYGTKAFRTNTNLIYYVVDGKAHWGRMTHIWVTNLGLIDSDN